MFVRPNERDETPAQFIKRVIVDDPQPHLSARHPEFPCLLGPRTATASSTAVAIFPRGGLIHCVDLRYPRGEKRAWDAIVTRISLGLGPRDSTTGVHD